MPACAITHYELKSICLGKEYFSKKFRIFATEYDILFLRHRKYPLGSQGAGRENGQETALHPRRDEGRMRV